MRFGAILLLLLAGCGEGSTEPAVTPGGARQEPYVAVPPGSVPRGASSRQALLDGPGPAATPALLRLGGEVYRGKCAPCHGSRGLGDGPVVAKGFPRPAPLAATPHPPAGIVRIVTEGKGAMPALAGQVHPVERWAVAYFIAAEAGGHAP